MAAEGEKREEKSFKVEDRRRFSPAGEPRVAEEKADTVPDVEKDAAKKGTEETRKTSNESLPEINFSTFVISLSTQVLMHLGEIPNPLDEKMERDLAVAKQMIDIIGMLREKTRGNLDSGEQKLMEDVLFDLRMRYVEAVKK